MARRIRSGFRSVLLLGGALVLSLTAILVGASANAVSSTARATGPAAAKLTGSSTGPTDIDHFACYLAKTANPKSTSAQLFTPPAAVSLTNQFTVIQLPDGATVQAPITASIEGVLSHCNPVQKTVGTPPSTTDIQHPDKHLLCFAVKTNTQPAETVTVTNQFGAGTLTTGQPQTLCLPTFKTVVPAGGAVPTPSTQTQPGNLDHYLCYAIANAANMPAPPSPVLLQDQFNFAKTTAKKLSQVTAYLGAPDEFCVPTLKTVNAAVGPVPSSLYHADAHMVCYPFEYSTATAGGPNTTGGARPLGTVYDQNQFGLGTVTVGKLNELCVPSFKGFPPLSTPTGTVTVTKLGADPNDPTGGAPVALSGATFTAYYPAGTTVGTCTTGVTGSCSITGLPTGVPIDVSETSPPTGYSSGPDQTVTIVPPVVPSLIFTDQPTAAGGCVTVTGSVVIGTNGVTSVSGLFTASDVGKTISGTGIPAGTTITSVIDPMHATISTGPTATGTFLLTIC
jgi:hypothetical protein